MKHIILRFIKRYYPPPLVGHYRVQTEQHVQYGDRRVERQRRWPEALFGRLATLDSRHQRC